MKFLITFLICHLLMIPNIASALSSRPQVRKIFIKGNKIISVEAIKDLLSTKVGHTYYRKKIKKDMQNIFQTGWFDKVEVHLTKKTKKSVALTYIVKEQPLVEKIIYEGHKSFTTKKLNEIFKFSPYEFLDYKKVQKSINNLYKEYEKKGYYLVRISHSIKKTQYPEKVRLIIKIKENKKVTIKKIDFIGNRSISSKEIKKFMGTRTAGFFSFLSSSGSYSYEVLEKDLNNIRFIYLDRGYWKSYVGQPIIFISPDRKNISISIPIHEGDQYKTGTIQFGGDLMFPISSLKEDLEITDSEIFSYGKLQRDIKKIQDKYGDKGYAFANVLPKFFESKEDQVMHVLFEIQKGKEVEVRKILISGNHDTRDKVIRREIRIFEGELYNATHKERSSANIRRLGFFEDVQIISKTIKGRDDLIDLEVNVKERERTGSMNIGVAYDGYNKFSFNGKLHKFNLFGTGRNGGLDMNFNFNRQYMNLNFSDPYFLDTHWYLGVDFLLDNWNDTEETKNIFTICDEYEKGQLDHQSKVSQNTFQTVDELKSAEDLLNIKQKKCWNSLPNSLYRGFSEQKLSGGITLGRSITDTLRLLWNFRLEQIQLSNSIDKDLFPVDQASGLRNPMEVTIEYDGRDDRLFPKSGFYLSHSLAYDGLIGKFNYLTFSSNVRFYQKLIRNVIFRNNFQYSRHIGLDESHAVPFDRLFRLGGIRNLRGFDFFSIGPRKQSQILLQKAQQYGHPNPSQIATRVYGGLEEMFFNWELQAPLFPKARVFGVLFVDLGTSYNEWSDMKWRSNWGFGVRVFTPMGPFRLEFGFPFFPRVDQGEETSHINFTMGYPF